jgi:hypothetical protein
MNVIPYQRPKLTEQQKANLLQKLPPSAALMK